MVTALAIGGPVRLHWAINQHCPARFSNVFEPIFEVEVVEEKADFYHYAASEKHVCWFYPRNVLSLSHDTFRDRIYRAYRLIWEHLKFSGDLPSMPEPALALHYRHHLPDVDPIATYQTRVLEVIQACRPRVVYVASDSDAHCRSLAEAIKPFVSVVHVGKTSSMDHDLDRSVRGVEALVRDLQAMSLCRMGVLANSSRSTVPDILRCLDVPSYMTLDDGWHRHNGRDDLFEREMADVLIARSGANLSTKGLASNNP